jgi:hypothetical protein
MDVLSVAPRCVGRLSPPPNHVFPQHELFKHYDNIVSLLFSPMNPLPLLLSLKATDDSCIEEQATPRAQFGGHIFFFSSPPLIFIFVTHSCSPTAV